MKTNKKFKQFIDNCHQNELLRGLFIQSYLIKPMGRVCKYPLLLRVNINIPIIRTISHIF